MGVTQSRLPEEAMAEKLLVDRLKAFQLSSEKDYLMIEKEAGMIVVTFWF